jgi:hypothetical protein
MQTFSRFLFPILAALTFFVPALAHAYPDAAIACCDNSDYPSSCAVMADTSDLSTCDPEAEMALCDLVEGNPQGECVDIVLLCCDEEFGAVWADSCVPHEPGDICDGAVAAGVAQ